MAAFLTTDNRTWYYWSNDTTATTSNIAWNTWTDSTSATTTASEASWHLENGIWQRWVNRPAVDYRHPQWAIERPASTVPRPTPVRSLETIEQAKRKAAQLLFEHLTDEQKAQYRKLGKFAVIGSDGKRYEMDVSKRMHNVFELDANGKRVREYCIYQQGSLPLADNHLAQKLLLEADAGEFKRIANALEILRTA